MPSYEIDSFDFFQLWLVLQVVTCLIIIGGYRFYHRGG